MFLTRIDGKLIIPYPVETFQKKHFGIMSLFHKPRKK